MNMNDPALRAAMQQRSQPVTFGGGGYSGERMKNMKKVMDLRADKQTPDEAKVQTLKAIADDLLRRVDSAPRQEKHDMLNDVEGIYTTAIDLDKPGRVPALWTNRSLGRIKNNKLDAAESDCEAAIQRDPKWTRAYLRLAFIASKREDWEYAIECTKMADSIAPDDDNKTNIEQWEQTLEAIPAKKREQIKKAKEAADANSVVFFADEDFVSDDYKEYIRSAGLSADVVGSAKDLQNRIKLQTTGTSWSALVNARNKEKKPPIAAMWFNVSGGMPDREVLDTIRDYIAGGGFFVALGESPLLRSGFDSLCPQCTWKPAGYCRLSPEVNRAAVPPPPAGCKKSISMKACWLDGQSVPEAEKWYMTKGAQQMQSMVFNEKVEGGQVGVAFHCPNTADQKGALMFIGDINWEPSSADVAMQAIQWWKTK